jgi:hypothetical protein
MELCQGTLIVAISELFYGSTALLELEFVHPGGAPLGNKGLPYTNSCLSM